MLKLTTTLTFPPTFPARSMPTSLVFSLSAVPHPSEQPASDAPDPLQGSPSISWIRETIREPTQVPLTLWDDRQAVLLGVRSGPVKIALADGPTRIASEKGELPVLRMNLRRH